MAGSDDRLSQTAELIVGSARKPWSVPYYYYEQGPAMRALVVYAAARSR